MSTAFGRPQGGGSPAHVDACGQRRGEGVKNLIFVDVINGWPLISSDFPRSSSIFSIFFNFPLFLRCSYVFTLNFLPRTKVLHFLPPKLTKPFVSPLSDKFSHKMGMMKISASFPHGMDASVLT